jgi:hypothetical protein
LKARKENSTFYGQSTITIIIKKRSQKISSEGRKVKKEEENTHNEHFILCFIAQKE